MLPRPSWLLSESDLYPPLLRESRGHPERLSYIGQVEALATPCISIVGSRRMSTYGEKVTRLLVPPLVRAGLTIVSGLAYGIDSLSHRIALEEGGRCVAVLGNGLPEIYPPTHQSLAELISKDGCILSEYEPGTPPLKQHFPERNRIVAGLSPFTLIIEAAARSGTLSTARHALEAGREVGVVPGDITALQSVGVHQLLRDGARPISTAQDILDVYGLTEVVVPTQATLAEPLLTIYNLIPVEGRSTEWLQRQLDCSPVELQVKLSQLELDGYIYSKHQQWLRTS